MALTRFGKAKLSAWRLLSGTFVLAASFVFFSYSYRPNGHEGHTGAFVTTQTSSQNKKGSLK